MLRVGGIYSMAWKGHTITSRGLAGLRSSLYMPWFEATVSSLQHMFWCTSHRNRKDDTAEKSESVLKNTKCLASIWAAVLSHTNVG